MIAKKDAMVLNVLVGLSGGAFLGQLITIYFNVFNNSLVVYGMAIMGAVFLTWMEKRRQRKQKS